jgi:hypothetical protein
MKRSSRRLGVPEFREKRTAHPRLWNAGKGTNKMSLRETAWVVPEERFGFLVESMYPMRRNYETVHASASILRVYHYGGEWLAYGTTRERLETRRPPESLPSFEHRGVLRSDAAPRPPLLPSATAVPADGCPGRWRGTRMRDRRNSRLHQAQRRSWSQPRACAFPHLRFRRSTMNEAGRETHPASFETRCRAD